jgi:hypothetical protein
VCVWERERERERSYEDWGEINIFDAIAVGAWERVLLGDKTLSGKDSIGWTIPFPYFHNVIIADQ